MSFAVRIHSGSRTQENSLGIYFNSGGSPRFSFSAVHEQHEVWRLEEIRAEYVNARDVENFRAMYHEDFIGWPSRVKAPVGQSELGYKIIEAIKEEREIPPVRLRREAIQIFGDVAIVHYSSSRSAISESDGGTDSGKWMKITHTWMRVGDTWKIIGGMAAPLSNESE